MVESFFLISSETKRQMDLHTQTKSITNNTMHLLSGPPSSGKTSLLFQFAFNATNFTNEKVVFICNRHKLQTKPPFLSQGIDPSSDAFQRIQMKFFRYVDNDEAIKNYFAAFHLHETFPDTVIVDDFGDFFEDSCQERYGNRGRELAMIRTLALCHNAIMHANGIRPCKLLLSDTHHGESTRLLFIYKRWVSTIFIIKGDGDGTGSFILRSNNNLENERTKSAKYCIALQYLVLEVITEDCEM
ncbi:uncharacterized protein LOC115715271 isoform X2 [Cannabis sativa]|uniref:uncharacterized protein LOC115715271 isoform X2 n=1 Tax=Cannabis sativa TaxID=3483 RepID=UPI0029C9E9F8|nr:uncharacterized protein LOC115715271 isoform X2 [Cannabis sativa]